MATTANCEKKEPQGGKLYLYIQSLLEAKVPIHITEIGENIKENLTWCEEGSLKIPYLNNIRIKAIRFTNKNIDILSTFES